MQLKPFGCGFVPNLSSLVGCLPLRASKTEPIESGRSNDPARHYCVSNTLTNFVTIFI
jgi:hypothetical protein